MQDDTGHLAMQASAGDYALTYLIIPKGVVSHLNGRRPSHRQV
jgi:hypothetical protein